MNIEAEIEERLDYKMSQILIALENRTKANWDHAFQYNSQKHCHYWEAFKEMRSMLLKEIELPVPYDNMAEQVKRKKRDIALDKIMNRFCKKSERDYYEKERFLAGVLNEIM